MAKNDTKRDILDKFVDDNPHLSKNEIIKQNKNLGVHHTTLYRWLDRKVNSGSASRIVAPDRPVKIGAKSNINGIKNFSTNVLVDSKCRRLLNANRKNYFIIDDESYFTLSNNSLSGNDQFYSDNLDNTPEDVMYKSVQKYQPKLLVWLAISPKVITEPFIAKSGLAINQERYLEIIQRYLEPFIKNKYPNLVQAHAASVHKRLDQVRRGKKLET